MERFRPCRSPANRDNLIIRKSRSLCGHINDVAYERNNEIVNIPLHIFLKNLNDIVYWNKSPFRYAPWGFIPIRRRVYAIWGTEA